MLHSTKREGAITLLVVFLLILTATAVYAALPTAVYAVTIENLTSPAGLW